MKLDVFIVARLISPSDVTVSKTKDASHRGDREPAADNEMLLQDDQSDGTAKPKRSYRTREGERSSEGQRSHGEDDVAQKLGGISGRLSQELVKQGLLSEDMLQQLQTEWQQASRRSRLDFGQDSDGGDDENGPQRGRRKKPGKKKK